MSCFLSNLPLVRTADAAFAAAAAGYGEHIDALSSYLYGELTCVYVVLQQQHVPAATAADIFVSLRAEYQGQVYQLKKKAFLYALPSLDTAIYTLPALIHQAALPLQLQQLVAAATKATATTATAANNGSAGAAVTSTANAVMSVAATSTVNHVSTGSTSSATNIEQSAPDMQIQRLPLQVYINTPQHQEECLGVVDFVIVNSDKKSYQAEEHYFEYLERWLEFFDFLLRSNNSGSDDFANPQLVRFADLNALLEQYCGQGSNVTRSRILYIAEQVSGPLSRINNKLRKSLINTRKLLPVERINAMDGKCLEYLLRLEGNSLREKAQHNKMRLLGLAKEETFNLLENRVLKDFLERCTVKATQYMQEIKAYTNQENSLSSSAVMKKMSVFKHRCQELVTNSPLSTVPRQTTLPKPNFVLQKDTDYKKIWQMYLDLIHEKRDLDQTLYCQQNLFQDLCDLLVNAALCDLCRPDHKLAAQHFTLAPISQSFVDISTEQLNGHRIKLGCNAGPFLLTKTVQAATATQPALIERYVLEVVTFGSRSYQHLLKVWERAGIDMLPTAPSYLLFTEASSVQQVAFAGGANASQPEHQLKQVIVPIFTMHHALNSDEERKTLQQNVKQQLLSIRLLHSVAAKKSVDAVGAMSYRRPLLYPCFIVSEYPSPDALATLANDAKSDAATVTLSQQVKRGSLSFESLLQGDSGNDSACIACFFTNLSLMHKFWIQDRSELERMLFMIMMAV